MRTSSARCAEPAWPPEEWRPTSPWPPLAASCSPSALIASTRAYAALLLDSNRARIIVFGLGEVEARTEVTGEKTRRHSMGGWSQARYQRRIDNIHLQHVKEVVDALDTVVRGEAIGRIIVAGDAGAAPSLTESSSGDGAQQTQVHLADPLVTKATQTGAAVRIIEDPELLRAHGGVAAALRFRI